MIEVQTTLENYPEFGNNATKVMPDAAKYSNGFVQADVLPAEWMNWAWSKNTKGITALNEGVKSMEEELTALVREAGNTPSEADSTQVKTAVNKLINNITGTLSNLTTSVKTNLVSAINDHKSKTGTNAHGATSAATANQIITRDASGRAKIANPSDDADIANKGWVNSLRQSFFDAAHPVGDIYIQFPSITGYTTKTPQELYNVNGITSTWSELNYGGAFFRSNGGNSSTFDSGKQAEGVPGIKGSASSIFGGAYRNFTGAFIRGSAGKGGGIDSSGSPYNFTFSAESGEVKKDGTFKNDVYGKSDHVTPENYTIKVWLRTA